MKAPKGSKRTSTTKVSLGENMIELGSVAKDTVSGLKGVVTSEHRYLSGHIRYGVQPKAGKNGSLPEPRVFDQEQLRVVKPKKRK